MALSHTKCVFVGVHNHEVAAAEIMNSKWVTFKILTIIQSQLYNEGGSFSYSFEISNVLCKLTVILSCFLRYLFALSRTILLKNLCNVKNVPSDVFMYIKMVEIL